MARWSGRSRSSDLALYWATMVKGADSGLALGVSGDEPVVAGEFWPELQPATSTALNITAAQAAPRLLFR